MKFQLWAIGKPNDKLFDEAISHYTKRIGHYFTVTWRIFPASKRTQKQDAMQEEASVLWHARQQNDIIIALDENGKLMSSSELASLIERKLITGSKNLIFAIGGAYGFDRDFLKKCDLILSLSPLTFPHQLVRLILSEQLYRACTILRNEGYHH